MCGRYALALRPSQIRQMLVDDGLEVDDAPEDTGDAAPRNSYNFAPGYHGVVYRADTSDRGAEHNNENRDNQADDTTESTQPKDHPEYKLQSMKWGLIPSWTKRNPDFGSMLKTINCRDDSLSSPGGMWASMKARKRCIVIAQGFYEWLKVGKDKVPHYVKRKDGHLMCFAGLWDCVQYEGSKEKLYSYTIITTSSNSQLKFLHDRMPVILEPRSSDMATWLDPSRDQWSSELQSLLRPWGADLEVYPVSKDVGKVGNNSPTFIIPLDSKENKSNIKNFFAIKSEEKEDVTERAWNEEKKTHDKKTDNDKAETSEATKGIKADVAIKRKATEDPGDDVGNLHKQRKQQKVSAIENRSRGARGSKKKGSANITRYLINKTP
ncbi:DNA-directed rna polymerase iii subunit rpc1 [Fusarium acuminatum]|uniref:DNA-directed rna polymerase iii subunit rpc1 n=1 Tax=Fusarium acuminatum TaxID=5515 RepID=A0ABZ2WS12_9HYPO